MIRAALLSLLLAGPAAAQDAGAAAAVRAAAEELERAQLRLERAEGAGDRVKALTATVRAFEAGLAGVRDSLRTASGREAQISRRLAAREGEVARLLGVLQTLSRAETPQQLLHPGGPMGAARAGMLVSAVTPALAEEAEVLRRDLEEAETIRALQRSAEARLTEGLAGVQAARAELSRAIADRTDLPKRFTEDPVKTAILIGASETLTAFASGLGNIPKGDEAPTDVDIRHLKGELALPVPGRILREAGEADAAGIERPGIVIETPPQALVTTPVPATLRYRGPLLDLGLVSILEPQPDLLFVFAGLGTVYGEIGEVMPQGAPVGLMDGQEPAPSPSGDGALSPASDTLYMEVREGQRPVDPLTWFATDKG
ncbi:peptidase M23B [Roseivivax halodurans JCM 10272]|uniref:Peptidase M23B n=1 Tax=Roseivivax halodurans JCM 10272 TaxID=1449350 RepID=X7ED34_9RHOB|nr:peptidase M23 [Roseivivax halodurans]ETX13790.1 peptidase M23B [Roseivivax halodurans JCM 10272]